VLAADLFSQIERAERPDLRDLRMLLEASYWRGEFQLLEDFVTLIDRSPNILPYLVTFLIQENTGIPEATRQNIAKLLGERLNADELTSDYEVICVARILSAEPYRNSNAMSEFVGSDRFHDLPSALMQFVLGSCGRGIGQAQMAFLEERFDTYDPRAQRAIARLLLSGMSEDRRSAFLRRERPRAQSDLFLQSIFASHGP
jgi:hypothetical protein